MKRMRRLFEALYRVYEHPASRWPARLRSRSSSRYFRSASSLARCRVYSAAASLPRTPSPSCSPILPEPVAKGSLPRSKPSWARRRIDLLTVSGFLRCSFATNAIETLRAALNGAYRVREKRPYPLCLLISMLFVFVSAISIARVDVGRGLRPQRFRTGDCVAVSDRWLKTLFDSTVSDRRALRARRQR